MSLDKLFSANDETSTIRSSQLLFLYQERISPRPASRSLVYGNGRGTRCWPSCWYDCQFVRHPICASGGAGVVHILINPAHPKSSEQAEGYHHLSPHFSFPRSKVEICVLSSPRRLEGIPETGFTLFGSGIGRAQIAHCMSFRSVLLKQP